MDGNHLEVDEIKFFKAGKGQVAARADIHFLVGFWLKGFKVIQSDKAIDLYVTPPSYHDVAANKWYPYFRTDKSEDWAKLQEKILEKYYLWDEEEASSRE